MATYHEQLDGLARKHESLAAGFRAMAEIEKLHETPRVKHYRVTCPFEDTLEVLEDTLGALPDEAEKLCTYTVSRHLDSYVSVRVKAYSEEEAIRRAQYGLDDAPDSEILANIEPAEEWVECVVDAVEDD